MRSVKAGVLVLGLLALGCADGTTPMSETEGLDGAEMTEAGSESSATSGGTVYGVDADNYLVAFDLGRPGRVSRRVRITGTGGAKVVGIDFRPSAVAPATPTVIGKLYGITKRKIFEIDPNTGYASNGQLLTVPLVGAFFGTGFNPTVDRLRNHGNTQQNVRLNVADGMTTQDTNLAYAAGDPGYSTAPSIAGTAYTNSDNDPATLTVLYAIDARRNVLTVLPSPNSGQLTTVGRLGARTSNFVGFDIPGEVQTGERFGYASLTDPSGRSRSALYKVDLDTGDARRIGEIGNRAPLVSIALAP